MSPPGGGADAGQEAGFRIRQIISIDAAATSTMCG
jgi:hypothetical protein